ncbi:MAG: hypothetical protein ACLSTO_10785 [Bilophila wadsworthia]
MRVTVLIVLIALVRQMPREDLMTIMAVTPPSNVDQRISWETRRAFKTSG